MDVKHLTEVILRELDQVNSSGPLERLPKEEQTRCIVYSELRPKFRTVCAERGYGSVDNGSRTECDIWAENPDQPQVFMEIKHAWSAPSSLQNKPTEQRASWLTDLSKLEGAPQNSDRYFVMVGFFEGNPAEMTPSARSVLSWIHRLHPERRMECGDAKQFYWRQEGITHAMVYIWFWPSGVEIDTSGD